MHQFGGEVSARAFLLSLIFHALSVTGLLGLVPPCVQGQMGAQPRNSQREGTGAAGNMEESGPEKKEE